MPERFGAGHETERRGGHFGHRQFSARFFVRGFGSFLALAEIWPKSNQVYDASSEKTYTIVTGQADSEVLLVENGTVYYRSADKLYSAEIGEDGLKPARLLATSELIRDAHWAFTKRQ